MVRLRAWLVAALLAVVVVGCSGGGGGEGSSPSSGRGDVAAGVSSASPGGGASSGAGGGPTSVGVSSTSAPSEALPGGGLPLSDAEAACVAEWGGGAGVAEDCVQELSLAPVFVAGLVESFPGVYDDAQLECLGSAYVGLDDAAVAVITGGGLFPEGDDAVGAAEVLAGLFVSCGAPLPPELATAVAAGVEGE